MTVTAAELDADRRDALKDSDFAVPGKRKLPIHDANHVRVAMGRLNQTQGLTDGEKAAAKTRIKAAAKRMGIEVSDDFAEYAVFGEPLLLACAAQPVEGFAEGRPLPFIRVGEHSFEDYGDINITPDDLDRIVDNYRRNARRQDLAVVNEEHIPASYSDDGSVLMGPGAIGWISDMYRDGDTVMFVPDWNAAGERLLEEDRYRGISPELLMNWTDPETGEAFGLTAVGVALTNRPRMKNLAVQGQPLAAGEGRVLAYAERPYLFASQAPDGDGDDDGDGGQAQAGHGPFTGSHTHQHPAFGAQGDDDTHSHKHSHDGDAVHDHSHAMAEGDGDGDGGKVDCPTCKGDGKVMGGKRDCPDCDGSGKVTPTQAQKLKGTELSSVHIDQPLTALSISYAYPRIQRLPLHTAEAVKGARARFLTIDASEEERDGAWAAVREAAQRHGVEVPGDWRQLKASEAASLLMQEYVDDTVEDVAAGQLPPCCFQPPYSDFARCPGFTRSDPDGDGDSDCCAMAAKGCNGYIPLVQVQAGAGFVSPQAATYYRERSRPGGPMSKQPSTKEDQTAVQASEPAQPAPEPAAAPPTPAAQQEEPQAPSAPAPAPEPQASPEPAPATPVAPVAAPAAPQPEAQSAANLAEFQSILAAERREREAMATRLAAAEANVQTERDARLRMEAATRLSEVAGRVESLVRSGRITPAQRDLLMAEPAKFTEDDSLLRVLEAGPENGAVDMRERGSGAEESRPESDRLEAAAKALMSERQQSVDPNDSNFFPNYKRALLDVGRTGYRAR